MFVAVLAVAFSEETKEEQKVVPLTYYHSALPYYNTLPYAYNYHTPLTYTHTPLTYTHSPLTYTYQPVETKFVPKEVEVEVKSYAFEPEDTKCVNSFGNPVPCRKARSADEEEMKDEETKKIIPLTYASPFYNSFYPYAAYPSTYTYTHAAPITYTHSPVVYKALEPKVQEIEYTKPVFKHTVEKIPLKPLCQNAWGWPVACADN